MLLHPRDSSPKDRDQDYLEAIDLRKKTRENDFGTIVAINYAYGALLHLAERSGLSPTRRCRIPKDLSNVASMIHCTF